MGYSLELHELANAEYIDAYEWYEARKEGLGESFLQAADKRLQQIILNPLNYTKTSCQLS